MEKYGTGMVNWHGFEESRATSWQRQLHLFEVPFYYIEYGIAQLGALGVWMNYKNDPKKALTNYKNALSLGYTKSIPAIYETAGVKFDFSKENLAQLVAFIREELEELK
jgi:oligoendopeptidase F